MTSYYQEILGKTEGVPLHTAEVKATCWALVTKLLKVLFKEIHKVRMFALELGTIRDDNARVNGLFLYAALEELRVLQEFASHDYRRHPKYNQCVILHLFDTSLPRSVYEKRTDGAGRETLLLELSPKGTYVMYPYPESLKDRVPNHAHRYIRYLFTTQHLM